MTEGEETESGIRDPVYANLPEGISEVAAGIFLRLGFTLEEAERWHRSGFEPNPADAWRTLGFDPAEAVTWRDAGLTRNDVRWARNAGLSFDDVVDEAHRWRAAGVGASDTEQWKGLGADLSDATRWRAAGFATNDFRRALQADQSFDEYAVMRQRELELIKARDAKEAEELRQRAAKEAEERHLRAARAQRQLKEVSDDWAAAGASEQIREEWIKLGRSPAQYLLSVSTPVGSSEPLSRTDGVPTVILDDREDRAVWADGRRLPPAVDRRVGGRRPRRRSLERLGFKVVESAPRSRFLQDDRSALSFEIKGKRRSQPWLFRVRHGDDGVVAEELTVANEIHRLGSSTDERGAVGALTQGLVDRRPTKATVTTEHWAAALDWLVPLAAEFPQVTLIVNGEKTVIDNRTDGVLTILPEGSNRWPFTKEFDGMVERLGGRAWLVRGPERRYLGNFGIQDDLLLVLAALPALELTRETHEQRTELVVTRQDEQLIFEIDGEQVPTGVTTLIELIRACPGLHEIRPGESFDLRFAPSHGLDLATLRSLLALVGSEDEIKGCNELTDELFIDGATNWPISINGESWMFIDVDDGSRILLERPESDGFWISWFVESWAGFKAIENASMVSGWSSSELAFVAPDVLLEFTIPDGHGELAARRARGTERVAAIVDWASGLTDLTLDAIAETVIGENDDISGDMLDDDGSASLEIVAWAQVDRAELIDYLNAHGCESLVNRYVAGTPEHEAHVRRSRGMHGTPHEDSIDDDPDE